jgi:hypothetical protein
MHRTIHLSPLASNSMPDVRRIHDEALNYEGALTLGFRGDGLQPFNHILWEDGHEREGNSGDGRLGIDDLPSMHEVDVYITRTSIRVLIDGRAVFDERFGDLGFDRAYVYFAQLAYNPNKDGYVGPEANTFRWDNIAFDGPVLPSNSLTPEGHQDIFFRGFSASDCTLRGMTPVNGPPVKNHHHWATWHFRAPLGGEPFTLGDVTCQQIPDTGGPAAPRDLEVVRR